MSISLAIFNAFNSLAPPRPFFAARRWWLNASGVKVGKGTRISSGVRVYDRFVEIDSDTWVGPEVSFFSSANGKIHIGSCVDIAPACKFFAGTHKIGGPDRRAGDGTGADISIGDGCWIGGAAKVLPGASVGSGTVIAAGSVVIAGKYPENIMLAGNPAQIVKKYGEQGAGPAVMAAVHSEAHRR